MAAVITLSLSFRMSLSVHADAPEGEEEEEEDLWEAREEGLYELLLPIKLLPIKSVESAKAQSKRNCCTCCSESRSITAVCAWSPAPANSHLRTESFSSRGTASTATAHAILATPTAACAWGGDARSSRSSQHTSSPTNTSGMFKAATACSAIDSD
jgi:hypothetical protein